MSTSVATSDTLATPVIFEENIEAVVKAMKKIRINGMVAKQPVFYFGIEEDLNAFVCEDNGSKDPLIWSVTKKDNQLVRGAEIYRRRAQINFCAHEDRVDLLNTTRIREDYSFKTVLYPMWMDFVAKAKISGSVNVKTDTACFTKHPNYAVSDQRPANVIWDVLRVDVTIEFKNGDAICSCH
jgi:hypothetical protein